MERDRHETPARYEELLRSVERPFEAPDLVVHEDPHRLKHPLRRVAAPLLPADRRAHGPRQLHRRKERTTLGDLPGDPPSLPARHVPVADEDVRDLRRLGLVQKIRRGPAGARVHAHVERALLHVAEATLGLVDLEAREPEVEEDAVRPHAFLHEPLQNLVVGADLEGEPRVLTQLGRPFGGLGIAVDGYKSPPGPELLQYSPGVPPTAEGGVDDRLVALGRERLERLF